MPGNIDDLLPTAARLLAAAEADKKKLIDRPSRPSGISEEEKVNGTR